MKTVELLLVKANDVGCSKYNGNFDIEEFEVE